MNDNPGTLLEICVTSIQSVLIANRAGAHRLELCANLEQGGITPSYGLIQRALLFSKIPIHVLIRPRAGNFVYNSDEFRIMLEDIKMCKQLGCHGIVAGMLTPDNTVDIFRMRVLATLAYPLPVTFHRAFDDCDDKDRALEDAIASGCTRILTSGGCDTAEEGIDVLKQLVVSANGRIHVMPGAGVGPANVAEIVELTGVVEVHASAKRVGILPPDIAESRFDVDVWIADKDTVESLVRELKTVRRQ